MAGLLVVAILVGAGAVSLSGNATRKTITSTSISTTTYTGTTVIISSATTITHTTTLSTSPTNASAVCVSNLANPPQSQYNTTIHQITQIPSFIQYSNGRCWTWEGTFEQAGPGYSNEVFVFDHFSNQIWYPCGLFPAYVIDTRVYVIPSFSNGNVTGVSIQPQQVPGYFCPALTNTIQPVWLKLVTWNSSGQTVSLKLLFSFSNASLRSLEARIYNASWSYVISFSQVNSTNPLQPGSYATQEVFITGAPLRGNIIYDLTATGTYVNGTQTISDFEVQLQT